MKRFTALLIATLTVAGSPAADELYGVPLAPDVGHVFLSPTKRQEIERHRGQPAAEEPAEGENASVQPDASAKPSAFGLIVGPNRKPLVWVDGEFRESSVPNLGVRKGVYRRADRGCKRRYSRGAIRRNALRRRQISATRAARRRAARYSFGADGR